MYLLTRKEVDKDEKLLPKADYSNLKSFINTISDEDLGELIRCCDEVDEDKMVFLGFIIGAIFMEEYEQDEFRGEDLVSLCTRFLRELAVEASYRMGFEEREERDCKLVPTKIS